MAVEWRVTWARCPVLVCLVGLFLLGVWQITPLPRSVLEVLAPGTAALHRELLPATPEQFAAGEPVDPGGAAAGQVISLYPGGTRSFLVGLLAVVVLFAVVRNNLTTPDCLRRLAVAALVNGALLSVFGLLQFFSSQKNLLYWSVPSQGTVFGPFINRNHFACYANLCIGLGVGVLVYLRHAEAARETGGSGGPGELALLLRPRVLCAGLALVLMLAAVAICLSRGGLVALLAGGGVCLGLSLTRRRRPPQVWGGLLVAAAAVGLVAWLSFQAVQARLGTLWRGDALEEIRPRLWARVLTLWWDFPVWGAGFGSFFHLEPLTRAPGQDRHFYFAHADNDWLELLLEGGTVGVILAVAAVGLIYWLGGRAFRRLRGSRIAGLWLGAFFALTTVTVHGFFDYGLHIPAVTLLATVIAAQLSVRKIPEPSARPGPSEAEGTHTLGGLAPLVGVAAAVVAGLVLVHEGWNADRAERYRLAAERCQASPNAADQARRRRYLRAAVRLAPDNALLWLSLAEANYDAFEKDETARARQARLRQAAEVVWGGGVLATMTPCCPPALSWAAGAALRDAAAREADRPARDRDREEYLKPALLSYARARNLCPLLGWPNIRLASHTELLAHADTPAVYLRRATQLMPQDERAWFVRGARALEDGGAAEAWPSWRRSLECSPKFLATIVAQAGQHLTPAAVAEQVIPPDPLLLYQAALLQNDRPDVAEAQRPYLEAALRQFDRQGR